MTVTGEAVVVVVRSADEVGRIAPAGGLVERVADDVDDVDAEDE